MSQRGLTELFRGKGAHVDPIACVEGISAEIAARQVAGFPHSIGQLVFHINYWMEYELRRIRGMKPAYPEHSSESFPVVVGVDASEWDRLRMRLAELMGEFAELAKSSAQEMQREIESAHEGDKKIAGTLEDVLMQMIAQQLLRGKIAMLRRMLGAWPPCGGGDSW